MSLKLFGSEDLLSILNEVSEDEITTNLCLTYLSLMGPSLPYSTYLLMTCEYELFDPYEFDVKGSCIKGEVVIFDSNNQILRDNMLGTRPFFFRDSFIEGVGALLLDEDDSVLNDVMETLSNYLTTLLYIVFSVDLKGTNLVLKEIVQIDTHNVRYLSLGRW